MNPYNDVYLLTFLIILGNVYIADTYNQRIRKVMVSTGIITTIAGSSTSGSFSGDNGAATSATLNGPSSIVLDSSGKHTCISYKIIHTNSPNSQGTCTSLIRIIIVSVR